MDHPKFIESNKNEQSITSAYFDSFQIVAVSFIAEFSYPFCCFVFDINQFKFEGHYAKERKRTPNKCIA